VVVAFVPWARHGAGHTLVFDQTVAWLATQTSKTAVTEMMRIGWRTVGAVVARFWADCEQLRDRFSGVRRLGINEVSYKRGQRYLTVVVDHDIGHLLWAAPGRDSATFAGVLRSAGAGPVRVDHPCLGRWCPVHQHRGQGRLPERGPLR